MFFWGLFGENKNQLLAIGMFLGFFLFIFKKLFVWWR